MAFRKPATPAAEAADKRQAGRPSHYSTAVSKRKELLMPDVICPNCQAIVRPWLACSNCGISFPKDRTRRTTAAGAKSSTREGAVDIDALPNLQMDAHLHRVIGAVRSGRAQRLATSSTRESEVAVIARVEDVDAFTNLSGVRVSAEALQDSDTTWLITARIPVDRVE